MQNQYVEDLNRGSQVAYEFFKVLGNVTSYLNQNLMNLNKHLNIGNNENKDKYSEVLKSYSELNPDDYNIIKSYDNLQDSLTKNENRENKIQNKNIDEGDIEFNHLYKNLSNVEKLLEKLKENFNVEDFEKLKEELSTITEDFNSSIDELSKKISDDFYSGKISKLEYTDLTDKIDSVCYEIKNRNVSEKIEENFQNIYDNMQDYNLDQNSLDYIDYRDYNDFYGVNNELDEKPLEQEKLLDKDEIEREI